MTWIPRDFKVVIRRLVLERDEKEHFRGLMRRHEQFTDCRVLAYGVMRNHFHTLLEVPPRPETGLAADSLDRTLFVPNCGNPEFQKRLE